MCRCCSNGTFQLDLIGLAVQKKRVCKNCGHHQYDHGR